MDRPFVCEAQESMAASFYWDLEEELTVQGDDGVSWHQENPEHRQASKSFTLIAYIIPIMFQNALRPIQDFLEHANGLTLLAHGFHD
jgi:hypothetical protein